MKTALLALALLAPIAHAADPVHITEAELVRRSQQMYDSLPGGDKSPWQRYYADDAMVSDEKGHLWNKAEQLADISPFPAGYSGSIKVVKVKSRIFATVAILSYDCDETEDIFTNHLRARYHSTDTWLYRNGVWQVIATQTLRYYEDPVTGAVNAALLNDYLGTYELAPGNTLVVTRDGDKLFTTRGKGKPVELLAESPDMFFRAGVEGRRLFHRDAAGKVNLLIDRRNNEDLLWKKIQ